MHGVEIMRVGLVIVGVLFLIFGGVFYAMPVQETTATTTTVSEGDSATRTAYASFVVPIQLILALLLSGLAIFVLGLAIPGSLRSRDEERDTLVEETKSVEGGDGTRHIRKERHEHVSKA
jgi:hypothetical protein